MWNARRILKELVDADRRRAILVSFWKHADAQQKLLAQIQLARALHFRDETIRKMPPEKKADLLASRIGVAEFEQFFEMALMHFHTHEKNRMMGAFLDQWHVPHDNGSIESDDYTPPSADQVREAVKALGDQFDRIDVRVYLATAGLLMGGEWRDATWPVVEEMA
ncbi:MAG TPA: hypothetical protein VFO89_10865 [Thermoanaerobaculia bacterium]|nr:hypothetical protein [Thermoanaerobaculia bacterium]